MAKVVFSFDDKSAKKLNNKKNILGGKGSNLGEMGRLGLPVPPGFTITTDVCDIFYKNKKKLPQKIIKDIEVEVVFSFIYVIGWRLFRSYDDLFEITSSCFGEVFWLVYLYRVLVFAVRSPICQFH